MEGKLEALFSVVENMKNNNISIEIIMQATGLSKEDIDKL